MPKPKKDKLPPGLAKKVDAIRAAFAADDGHKKPWHARSNDFEHVDEITIKVEPYYKTSGLSGDVWKQVVKVVGKFKGVEVFEKTFRKVTVAAGLLYAALLDDDGIPNEVLEREKDACDQPGCPNRATNVYLLRNVYSQNGSFEADAFKKSNGRGYYRQFCDHHAQRGNAALEDADSNYTAILGGPENSSKKPEDEKPAAGPIIIDTKE